jgi:hypothetical protein
VRRRGLWHRTSYVMAARSYALIAAISDPTGSSATCPQARQRAELPIRKSMMPAIQSGTIRGNSGVLPLRSQSHLAATNRLLFGFAGLRKRWKDSERRGRPAP